MTHERIRLGTWACLLGEPVRFDGGHKRDSFLVESLGQFVGATAIRFHGFHRFGARAGLNYQRNAFQVGGEVVAVSKQGRVFGDETPTPGYNLLKMFASYSFGTGRATSTITARLDNATNELYRNHLSLIKDFVPEMGRNFKLVYSVRF